MSKYKNTMLRLSPGTHSRASGELISFSIMLIYIEILKFPEASQNEDYKRIIFEDGK